MAETGIMREKTYGKTDYNAPGRSGYPKGFFSGLALKLTRPGE